MTGAPDQARWTPARLVFLHLLVVLALGLLAFFAFDGGRFLDFENLALVHRELQAWVAAHPGLAPVAYMIAFAAVVALLLPVGGYATILGGLLFGPVLGTLWAAIGATTGAVFLFLAARTALGDVLRKRAGPTMTRMERGFRANAFSYLLTLRLVPLLPFAFVNLVPAFFAIPVTTYVAATFLGILPATFVFAGIGHGLSALMAEGRTPDLAALTKPAVLFPLLGLAALALLPVFWKKLRARRIED